MTEGSTLDGHEDRRKALNAVGVQRSRYEEKITASMVQTQVDELSMTLAMMRESVADWAEEDLLVASHLLNGLVLLLHTFDRADD